MTALVMEPGTRLHLLVVDDNAQNLRVAQLILASLGHTAELAPEAATALAWLAERPYDGVLMDCRMPNLDGYEATRQIRSGKIPGINPQIPIIAVTAHALPEDRARCLACGMDDYVPKPVRAADLRAALQRQLLLPIPPPQLDPETVKIAQSPLLPRLVALYLAEQPQHLTRIEAALQARNLAELADHAFGLAQEAAKLGAVAVRHAALNLERAARQEDSAKVEIKWRELCAAAEGLRPALAALNLLPA